MSRQRASRVVLIGIAIFIAATGVLAGRVAAATPNSGSVSGGAAFYGRGIKTLSKLPAKARALRATALSASAQAKTLASKFDFVNAVFSAQTAFRAAAAYRDMALNQPLGTTELQKGTKGTTGQGAGACPSAKS